MDRRSHEGRLDDDALLQRLREVRPLEAPESGPQPDIAGRGVLRLQPADLLHGLLDAERRPCEKELAGEQRSIQGALGQDPLGHAERTAFASSRSSGVGKRG